MPHRDPGCVIGEREPTTHLWRSAEGELERPVIRDVEVVVVEHARGALRHPPVGDAGFDGEGDVDGASGVAAHAVDTGRMHHGVVVARVRVVAEHLAPRCDDLAEHRVSRVVLELRLERRTEAVDHCAQRSSDVVRRGDHPLLAGVTIGDLAQRLEQLVEGRSALPHHGGSLFSAWVGPSRGSAR